MASTTTEEPVAATEEPAQQTWEYSLRMYLLLLATLVASVTYSAGFNPPGGVWQDTTAGHLAGDPIIRDIRYVRYAVFYYCNASAFASSLVVVVLILLVLAVARKDNQNVFILPLRVVMVLDLLSLMMAYAAGTCRDTFTKVYSSVLVSAVFAYVIFQVAQASIPGGGNVAVPEGQAQASIPDGGNVGAVPEGQPGSDSDEVLPKRTRKVLMMLATFAVSVTYVAGLSTPGGFWDNTEGGHRPGDAILKDRHNGRLTAFFVCNTTAFVASLLIIVLLLDSKLHKKLPLTSPPSSATPRHSKLYGCIMLALTSLVGAYAAGSCRETGSTAYVLGLVGAVVVCILIQFRLLVGKADTGSDTQEMTRAHSAPAALPEHNNGSSTENKMDDEEVTQSNNASPTKVNRDDELKRARSLVLLLATLAATITYQAGLDPPGGFWEDNGQGHRAGDPILLTTSPRRYKAFFYCNSVAFVASLVTIVLVQAEPLLRQHALEAAMILDLFGLIGAYAAGTCRDVSASIYVMALAGAVLVYVVIHVIFFTLDHKDNGNGADDELEKRRKRLLLFSILAATITYQAGLTPPGGFLLRDDKPFGGHHHRAGDPILLRNSPRRYEAFFYCNSVSFMLSIALIILLVNPNLYKPAIRSYALSVCTAAGLLGLMGAYAAGSTQHLSTSICIIALVAVVSVVILLLLLVFTLKYSKKVPGATRKKGREEEEEKKLHAKRKYLMLLGILVASVTYQAGLDPPGGFWQSSRDGHNAGHPVMYDNRRRRYPLPESPSLPSVDKFAERILSNTRQTLSLPSAPQKTLGKQDICRVPHD